MGGRSCGPTGDDRGIRHVTVRRRSALPTTLRRPPNRPIGQLTGIAVAGGVELHDSGAVGHDSRNQRALKRSRGGDHIGCLDHPFGRLDTKRRPAGLRLDRPHFHAATYRGLDLSCVGFEVLNDSVLGGKAVGIDVRELHRRKPVVPGRTVGDKGIPTFAAPTLHNPAPLDNKVSHTTVAQVPAHRQPGLATANDERMDDFKRHVTSLSTAVLGATGGERCASLPVCTAPVCSTRCSCSHNLRLRRMSAQRGRPPTR